MGRLRQTLATGLMVALLVLVGCATEEKRTQSDLAGGPQPKVPTQRVVAAIAPLAELVRVIGGSRVDVVQLAPSGAEPHDLELTIEQVSEVTDADLVVHIGASFIPSLEKVVNKRATGTLDVLSAVETRTIDGAVDPHVWLDPIRYASIGEAIAKSLAQNDPDGGEEFAAAAAMVRKQLTELDQSFRDGLAVCERRDLITAHAAFSYLASAYNLKQTSIAGLSPDSEPSPDQFAEVADVVKSTNATTVFMEEIAENDLAQALARETGAIVAVLSPIETLQPGTTYDSVMRENLSALSKGLNCR